MRVSRANQTAISQLLCDSSCSSTTMGGFRICLHQALASMQNCRNVDNDVWCKWALAQTCFTFVLFFQKIWRNYKRTFPSCFECTFLRWSNPGSITDHTHTETLLFHIPWYYDVPIYCNVSYPGLSKWLVGGGGTNSLYWWGDDNIQIYKKSKNLMKWRSLALAERCSPWAL